MRRVPPVVLALVAALLLATPFAAVAATPAPDDPGNVTAVGLSENTSRILPLDTQRSNFSTPDASVLASIRADQSAAEWSLSRRALSRRLAAADTDTARERILRNATDRAAAAVDALLARERAARNAYLSGETTTQQYVATLGELHARADNLLQFVGPRTDPAPGSILDNVALGTTIYDRALALQARVQPIAGDIAGHAATAVRGGTSPRLYVAASPNGFVLSTLSGRTYERTAYRSDATDDVDTRTIATSTSGENVNTYYPWAANGDGYLSSGIQVFDGYAYLHRISHQHGTIYAYVDASSGLPYFESRETALSVVATDAGWSNTSANATLSVAQSYPGGPLRVEASYNGSGVRVPVFVDGERVGTTNAKGVLWTLAPNGEFTVSTRVNDTDLRVEASTS